MLNSDVSGKKRNLDVWPFHTACPDLPFLKEPRFGLPWGSVCVFHCSNHRRVRKNTHHHFTYGKPYLRAEPLYQGVAIAMQLGGKMQASDL